MSRARNRLPSHGLAPEPDYLPRWFEPFTRFAPNKCIYGGRSSGKTLNLARWFVMECERRHVRLFCCRQFQRSIEESVKPSIEWAMHDLGVGDRFRVLKDRIFYAPTGSQISFHGLERNIENIRGWHGATDVWVEEANYLRAETAEVLMPTVRRGDHQVQVWMTFNPKFRTDWVWQRFVGNPEPDDVVAWISYRDNPWHSQQAEIERRRDRRRYPHRYAHIWEGWPDDGDGDVQVLPWKLLQDCVEAHRQNLHLRSNGWPRHAGLDIADGGADRNAVCIRHGPIVVAHDSWPSERPGFLSPTARRADRLAQAHDCDRLYYDTGGVGAPIREAFYSMGELPYGVRPVAFGGAVQGKRTMFARGRTNEQAFARMDIQLAWTLRLRAQRTVRLLQGEDVSPDQCLFVDPRMPDIDAWLGALTQPQWRENPHTGKMELDKRGDQEKSPDDFDALRLAFRGDIESGLRAR